ncbi:MAG: hypothetical protein BJ554DRAFT_5792 [Olpidium bornovanus]|uniref:C2H2-type domain-containing protein n=1 Tax=Olpidium bornovanus TaxID=278681 RepID=A0A8H7ZZ74_9FUNG|nr:MAG: hypothetical protein BJ554DRAFT_5792 [Olpidium bornovanus]
MRHEKKHLDQRPYSCPVCFKGFTRQDAVKRHLALHPVNNDAAFVAPPSLGQAVMSSAPMMVVPTCAMAPLAASVGVTEPAAFQPYADAFVAEPGGISRMSNDPQPCSTTTSFAPNKFSPCILPPS